MYLKEICFLLDTTLKPAQEESGKWFTDPISHKNLPKGTELLPFLQGSPDRALPRQQIPPELPAPAPAHAPEAQPGHSGSFTGLEAQPIILNWKHGAFPALSVRAGLTMGPSELALWESCPCRPGRFPCPAGARLSPRPAAAQPRLTLSRSCSKSIFLPATGKRWERTGRGGWRRCSLGNKSNF